MRWTGSGAYSPIVVDGLTAGDSIELTTSVPVAAPGNYTFIANVDVDNVIGDTDRCRA